MKKNNIQTTYDRHVQKMTPERKKKFDAEYRELVLSELFIALMQEDKIATAKLVREIELISS